MAAATSPALKVLVDSSVWIDHLRRPDERLVALLDDGRVLAHRFVLGELACGNFRDRVEVLRRLGQLPLAVEPRLADVRDMIEARALHGRGIGLVDCFVLGSAILDEHAKLWTRDRRLLAAAEEAAVEWIGGRTH